MRAFAAMFAARRGAMVCSLSVGIASDPRERARRPAITMACYFFDVSSPFLKPLVLSHGR